MKNFNMYQLCKIKIKYNSYNKNTNNSTYMRARQMILYSFERERRDKLQIAWIESLVDE